MGARALTGALVLFLGAIPALFGAHSLLIMPISPKIWTTHGLSLSLSLCVCRRFCSILWHEYQRALVPGSSEGVVLPHLEFSAACARLFDSLDADASGTVDFLELSSG